jgi:hypothetical protein
MKIGLIVDLQNGEPAQTLFTNMFVITEWEQSENRKVSDGRGMGFGDMCCWAHTILKNAGQKLPATWKQWVKENPEMTIVSVVDDTNPNHTGVAPTEDN